MLVQLPYPPDVSAPSGACPLLRRTAGERGGPHQQPWEAPLPGTVATALPPPSAPVTPSPRHAAAAARTRSGEPPSPLTPAAARSARDAAAAAAGPGPGSAANGAAGWHRPGGGGSSGRHTHQHHRRGGSGGAPRSLGGGGGEDGWEGAMAAQEGGGWAGGGPGAVPWPASQPRAAYPQPLGLGAALLAAQLATLARVMPALGREPLMQLLEVSLCGGVGLCVSVWGG